VESASIGLMAGLYARPMHARRRCAAASDHGARIVLGHITGGHIETSTQAASFSR